MSDYPARASVPETAAFVADVVAPLFARGVIVRRPAVEGLVDRFDADRRAVRRVQRLRDRYEPGPVVLRTPARTFAVVVSPDHVRRVLDEAPEPFAPANREKRAALSHFQPHGVLISHGAARARRRAFNEAVLDSEKPVHGLADQLLAKVREETAAMLEAADRRGVLGWDDFAVAWWRLVRRVMLGDAARDDHEITDLLAALRGDANWAYLKPRRDRLRQRFAERLRGYLGRAEPGSLAERAAAAPTDPDVEPDQQVPHWLFASDAAGMTALRAFALLATHPDHAQRVHDEIGDGDLDLAHELPYLRACFLEANRLWPTTPAILRDTTQGTD